MRYGAPFCSNECAEAASDNTLEMGQQMIPDYLNDLNAMHRAEKVLTREQWVTYGQHLDRMGVFPMVHATASQRAEAFLKTLNLWKDSE